MNLVRRTVLLVLIAGVFAARGVGAADEAGDPAEGRVVYERYCVSCHGDHGDGRGEAAAYEDPKPRDYRPAIFKCRSSPSGSLPLASDLERTLQNGLYGTHMPSWYPIGYRARRDAIAYIRTFSNRWTTEQPRAAMPIPAEPASSPDSIARGRRVYEQTGCASCHGDLGGGDGPSAKAGMTDVWGNAIAPADLTRGHFKCGSTSEDLYRSLVTGIDGTPMPSCADSLSSDQVWDEVHYLLEMGTEARESENWVRALIAPFDDLVPASFPAPSAPLSKVVVTEEQIVTLEPVRFEPSSAFIRAESFPVLQQIIRVMNERPKSRIRIEGHTDSKESPGNDRSLSEQRVQAVVSYMTQHGADPARLESVGLGSSRPVAPNTNADGSDNLEGQKTNRRTEFHILL
jgi:outer membrane protein OmpA-like peptidoglycan-associated protein/cytochrome c553